LVPGLRGLCALFGNAHNGLAAACALFLKRAHNGLAAACALFLKRAHNGLAAACALCGGLGGPDERFVLVLGEFGMSDPGEGSREAGLARNVAPEGVAAESAEGFVALQFGDQLGDVWAVEDAFGEKLGETVVKGAEFGFQARKQIRLQDVCERREASESGILLGSGSGPPFPWTDRRRVGGGFSAVRDDRAGGGS
jgi:hypothetical protein